MERRRRHDGNRQGAIDPMLPPHSAIAPEHGIGQRKQGGPGVRHQVKGRLERTHRLIQAAAGHLALAYTHPGRRVRPDRQDSAEGGVRRVVLPLCQQPVGRLQRGFGR